MTLSLALLLLSPAPAPQIIPRRVEAVIAARSRVPRVGRLDLRSLGLGDGGVTARPAAPKPSDGPTAKPRSRKLAGEVRTPGGVLIRAKAEGVKFDFPSGRELLLDPNGRVHLRSGEATLPFLRGVQFVLADGTLVRARRGGRSRRALASVEVVIEGRSRRIWTRTRRVIDASHSPAFVGTTLLALGDGGVLFRADVAGPVVALARVLCPKRLAMRTPKRRVVVSGDALVASLARMPAHAPRKSVQFPQVKEAAEKFAALDYLFVRSIPRPPGAAGELWFPLADRFRLKVEADSESMIRIGLYGEGAAVPGVEWTVAGKTELHFVRPSGGLQGGPRYFQRGIDLREDLANLLPVRRDFAARKRVAQVVQAIGGRTLPRPEVRRR